MKQLNFDKLVFFLLISLVITIAPGCQKEPAEPDSEDQSGLLVNSLGIALVKAATQTLSVTTVDKNGNPESFSVSSENSGIATLTQSNTTFTVTGVDYGSTKVIVTSASGKSKEIPVRIYDPQTLETEELLITYAQTFQDRGSYASYSISFWHPITSSGFYALGSLGLNNLNNPDGKKALIVVKAKEGSNALAHPVSYNKIYQGGFGSCWLPVPPEGYVALGVVATNSFMLPPSLNDVVCVRKDLTIQGKAGALLCGMDKTFLNWELVPPEAGPHEYTYLSTGTSIAEGSIYNKLDYIPPETHPAMNVLKIDLPMIVEIPYVEYMPRLTSLDMPPAESTPILAMEMLIPCTIISDPLYTNDHMWRISNSPFYRLERQVFYKLLYHNYNQTSIVQHNSYTKRFGVTTTESEEFWNETGISITAEAGIGFSFLSAKISATVSKSFGYSSMTSISELQEDEYQSGIDVPPGKAVAIWQRYTRFVLKRHNGTFLEPVKTWEFGINSFVTDEYPD